VTKAKALVPLAVLAIAALVAYARHGPARWTVARAPAAPSTVRAQPARAAERAVRAEGAARTVAGAFAAHARNVPVEDHGVVARLLKDDRQGTRHQRFLVQVDDGTTVLIAHNLELAPRVAPLAVGDAVAFRGEYMWNAKGGVVHWTHDDPDGRHPGGWVEAAGQRFH
jgi:hypothetical protein